LYVETASSQVRSHERRHNPAPRYFGKRKSSEFESLKKGKLEFARGKEVMRTLGAIASGITVS